MGNPKRHAVISWIWIAGLFLLRIPFFAILPILLPSTQAWVAPVFEIGTYLLTAIAIWWERDSLSEFHITPLALGIIVLGKPLELLLYQLGLPFDSIHRSEAYWLYLPISLALAVILIMERRKIPKLTVKDWLWPLAGIGLGIAVGIGVGILTRNQVASAGVTWLPLTSLFTLPAKTLIFLPIQQMFYAGIAEEPFFRGILWGALRRAGWRDGWAWLLQAGLFWLAHLYYFGKFPWSFWLTVPLGGLVLGWLAWRSRSISTSMVAHGCMNGFGQIVTFYLRVS